MECNGVDVKPLDQDLASLLVLDPSARNNGFDIATDEESNFDIQEYEDTVDDTVQETTTIKRVHFDENQNNEEARLLEKFQPKKMSSVHGKTSLADLILHKIGQYEKDKTNPNQPKDHLKSTIDPKVVKVYSSMAFVLKKFKSGKIPKAFQILPHVMNWESLIWLTKPHEWSPHIVYRATRMFVSSLNERMAQRFYSAILLPIIHTYIEEHKKLHPEQYRAVRKALFKPVAFFKGFLLPLLTEEEFECTLNEALIVGSIIRKCHLPPVPTAVTIVKLCEVRFSSAQCVILRILIDKKMGLPYQCIDVLSTYFFNFTLTHPSSEPLPVIWHQMLLIFIKYYKSSLNANQLEQMKQLCTHHFHYAITPEIRRYLSEIK